MTAREDFMDTYFGRDDEVTQGMVTDYLDRIEQEARQADRERMATQVERGEWDDVVREAYVEGHRHGMLCGEEAAGFGITECEHVGRIVWRPV